MEEKRCKDCHYGKDVGYQQVICKKTGRWEAELYSCERWSKRMVKRGEKEMIHGKI